MFLYSLSLWTMQPDEQSGGVLQIKQFVINSELHFWVQTTNQSQQQFELFYIVFSLFHFLIFRCDMPQIITDIMHMRRVKNKTPLQLGYGVTVRETVKF